MRYIPLIIMLGTFCYLIYAALSIRAMNRKSVSRMEEADREIKYMMKRVSDKVIEDSTVMHPIDKNIQVGDVVFMDRHSPFFNKNQSIVFIVNEVLLEQERLLVSNENTSPTSFSFEHLRMIENVNWRYIRESKL